MKIPVKSTAEVGLVMRMARKAQGLRADDLASLAGVGPVFISDAEGGKETIQLGKVLEVLSSLGVNVTLEVPASTLFKVASEGGKGLAPRGRDPAVHAAMLSRFFDQVKVANSKEALPQTLTMNWLSATPKRSKGAKVTKGGR